MDGWNTMVSSWGPAYFQGQTVSFREGTIPENERLEVKVMMGLGSDDVPDFNWVIFRFQPLMFQGVGEVSSNNTSLLRNLVNTPNSYRKKNSKYTKKCSMGDKKW